MIVLAATMSLLVALGVERLSYKSCPWMGAMWTCCEGASEHREPVRGEPAIGRRCCETRGFESLPPGDPGEGHEDLVSASEIAPLTPVSLESTRLAEIAVLPRGALRRGGVPPPLSRQRRLAMISVLRL